jgi:hypothetical protein
MKLSLKSSSLFAAVAMSIYSAFVIIAQTPLYDNVILSVDKYFVLSYVCTSLLLVSMLVLGVSIFINRKHIPVLSKSLLWQTRVITAILFFMLFCNIFSIASVYINGMLYFWWHGFEWLRYVMLFLITAWLWQFAYIKPKEYLSTKPLGNCGLAVSIGVGIVLLLMFISLVHVLFTGHVAGFRTNVLISWLKPISALVLMGMYLLVHRLSLSITPESHSGK